MSDTVATQNKTVVEADPVPEVTTNDPVPKEAPAEQELTVVGANPILVIPEEEFHSKYIDKNGKVLFNKTICIEYMQPGCATCKEFSPVWDEVAEQHVNSEV